MNLEKKKTVLVVCLVAIVLLSAFSAWMLIIGNRPQGEEYKAIAEQLFSEAREEFEKIRGISAKDVTVEVVNQSWVIENWGIAYVDHEEIRIEENIYKTLFMISQDVNLTEVKLQWTGMFHAAKWKGKIYVVEEKFDVTNEFKATSTFVHELTHIMQDSYSLPQRSTFDGSKALSSLKEGDATLMADAFKNDGIVPPPAKITKTSSSSLPETIDKLNRFVYRYGVEFVKKLYDYDTSSWNCINEAYKNPPTTTEQIIHPEKFFAKEVVLPVQVSSTSGNWSLTKTDRFGEYFILVMFDNWLPIEDAELAANGWGGDVFNYYQSDDDFLFTWDIVWDSNEDAHEFYRAFQDMMEQTSADEVTDNCWFASNRYLSIQLSENLIVIKSATHQTLVL